jgi:hypothetical protein
MNLLSQKLKLLGKDTQIVLYQYYPLMQEPKGLKAWGVFYTYNITLDARIKKKVNFFMLPGSTLSGKVCHSKVYLWKKLCFFRNVHGKNCSTKRRQCTSPYDFFRKFIFLLVWSLAMNKVFPKLKLLGEYIIHEWFYI